MLLFPGLKSGFSVIVDSEPLNGSRIFRALLFRVATMLFAMGEVTYGLPYRIVEQDARKDAPLWTDPFQESRLKICRKINITTASS